MNIWVRFPQLLGKVDLTLCLLPTNFGPGFPNPATIHSPLGLSPTSSRSTIASLSCALNMEPLGGLDRLAESLCPMEEEDTVGFVIAERGLTPQWQKLLQTLSESSC